MARKKPSPAPVNRDRWLISYADFLTLLLALFVVLFASSQLDRKKALRVSQALCHALARESETPSPAISVPVAIPEPEVALPQLTTSMNDLAVALAPETRTGKGEVHLAPRGLVISLRQAAYFPSGGDEIASSGLS